MDSWEETQKATALELFDRFYKRFVQCLFVLFIIGSCKSPATMRSADDCDCEIVFEKGPSIYDSIVPPRPLVDSILLYEQVANRLKFANNLKWEGGIDHADSHFTINENGQIESEIFTSSKDVEANMRVIVNYVLDQLKNWEPAYYKNNSSRKVSFRVQMTFYFHENDIAFKVHGPGYFYFLKKSFKRPIEEP